MSYLFFAWTASITSAIVAIVTKLTTKYTIANPWLFNFVWSLLILMLIIPFALMNQVTLPHQWFPIVIAGITGALFYVFYVLAIYKLDVSVMSPLFNFRTVFALILGIVFLNESLSFNQIILVGLVIVAGIFATIDEKFRIDSFFNPAVGLGLIAMLFLAFNSAATKWASASDSVWTVNLWVAFISFLTMLPTLPWFYKDLFKLRFKQLYPVGIMGLLQTVTNFALTQALAINVGITSIIMSIPLSMIFAFLLSMFAPTLLEKHTVKTYIIRFTAAAIMIVGAYQLSS